MPTTLQTPTFSSGTNYQVMPLPKAEISLSSVSVGSNQDEIIFRGLAETWRRETAHCSVLARRYAHPSYALILRMGDVVVPLILKELQLEPDRWFDALERLTKVNPAQAASTFEEGVKLWITWGRSKNLVS